VAHKTDSTKGTEPRHNPRLIGITQKTGFPPLRKGPNDPRDSRPANNGRAADEKGTRSPKKP
jgi:hypothetical protein